MQRTQPETDSTRWQLSLSPSSACIVQWPPRRLQREWAAARRMAMWSRHSDTIEMQVVDAWLWMGAVDECRALLLL